jgi:hypothetical protein
MHTCVKQDEGPEKSSWPAVLASLTQPSLFSTSVLHHLKGTAMATDAPYPPPRHVARAAFVLGGVRVVSKGLLR